MKPEEKKAFLIRSLYKKKSSPPVPLSLPTKKEQMYAYPLSLYMYKSKSHLWTKFSNN
jgi:hypothetical protein